MSLCIGLCSWTGRFDMRFPALCGEAPGSRTTESGRFQNGRFGAIGWLERTFGVTDSSENVREAGQPARCLKPSPRSVVCQSGVPDRCMAAIGPSDEDG